MGNEKENSSPGQTQVPPAAGPQQGSPPGYPTYQPHGYPGYTPSTGAGFDPLDFFDFRDLFRILWVQKRLILIVLAFALTCWFFYLSTATRIYQSESLLELSLRRPRISGQQEALIDDGRSSSTSEQLNTQITKLQGERLRRLVYNKVKSTLAVQGFETRESTMAFLKNEVDISLIRRTRMVKITVDCPDPDAAAFIANTYATEAVQEVLDTNKSNSKSAVEWLESQMETQRNALNQMEKEILEFKKVNPLETLKARRDAIRQSLAKYSEDLTQNTAERDRLLSLYTEEHPKVRTQQHVIAAAHRQYQDAIANAEELEKKIAEASTGLAALEREKEALEMAYKGILKRIEEARLSADENTTTIKISESAAPRADPIKPNKLISLLIFLVLGGGAAVGLAVIMHRVEDRIWYLDDIEETLGIRLIGTVPHVGGKVKRNNIALMSRDDQTGEIAESFGIIRALLDTFTEGKTYVISSPEPEEGKTVCSCNLAIASARSGKKTLLVDFDMRRPKLSGIWDIDDFEGALLKALRDSDNADFSVLPKKTDLKNLDIIVTRPVSNMSPAQLFGSRRVKQFLEWASSEYDRIILDTPPLCVASDAMVLGGSVDGAILAMRFNKTRQTMVRSAVRRLADTGSNLIGGVVTDVDAKRLGLTYGRYGNVSYTTKDSKN